jgi:hypothetical protein
MLLKHRVKHAALVDVTTAMQRRREEKGVKRSHAWRRLARKRAAGCGITLGSALYHHLAALFNAAALIAISPSPPLA